MKKLVAFVLSIMTFTGFIFPSPVFAATDHDHIIENHYHIRNYVFRNLSIEATGRGWASGYDTYMQENTNSWYQTIWLDYIPGMDVYSIRTSVTNKRYVLTLFASNDHLMYIDNENPYTEEALWKIVSYGNGRYVIRNLYQPDKILRTPTPDDIKAGDQLICQKPMSGDAGTYSATEMWSFVGA